MINLLKILNLNNISDTRTIKGLLLFAVLIFIASIHISTNQENRFSLDHKVAILSTAITANGNIMALSYADGRIEIRDVQSHKIIKSWIDRKNRTRQIFIDNFGPENSLRIIENKANAELYIRDIEQNFLFDPKKLPPSISPLVIAHNPSDGSLFIAGNGNDESNWETILTSLETDQFFIDEIGSPDNFDKVYANLLLNLDIALESFLPSDFHFRVYTANEISAIIEGFEESDIYWKDEFRSIFEIEFRSLNRPNHISGRVMSYRHLDDCNMIEAEYSDAETIVTDYNCPDLWDEKESTYKTESFMNLKTMFGEEFKKENMEFKAAVKVMVGLDFQYGKSSIYFNNSSLYEDNAIYSFLGRSEIQDAPPSPIIFSTNPDFIITVFEDNTLGILNTKSKKNTTKKLPTSNNKDVSNHILHQSYAHYAYIVESEGGQVKIWDYELDREIASIQHDATIDTIKFHPERELIVTIDENDVVSAWDYVSEIQIFQRSVDSIIDIDFIGQMHSYDLGWEFEDSLFDGFAIFSATNLLIFDLYRIGGEVGNMKIEAFSIGEIQITRSKRNNEIEVFEISKDQPNLLQSLAYPKLEVSTKINSFKLHETKPLVAVKIENKIEIYKLEDTWTEGHWNLVETIGLVTSEKDYLFHPLKEQLLIRDGSVVNGIEIFDIHDCDDSIEEINTENHRAVVSSDGFICVITNLESSSPNGRKLNIQNPIKKAELISIDENNIIALMAFKNGQSQILKLTLPEERSTAPYYEVIKDIPGNGSLINDISISLEQNYALIGSADGSFQTISLNQQLAIGEKIIQFGRRSKKTILNSKSVILAPFIHVFESNPFPKNIYHETKPDLCNSDKRQIHLNLMGHSDQEDIIIHLYATDDDFLKTPERVIKLEHLDLPFRICLDIQDDVSDFAVFSFIDDNEDEVFDKFPDAKPKEMYGLASPTPIILEKFTTDKMPPFQDVSFATQPSITAIDLIFVDPGFCQAVIRSSEINKSFLSSIIDPTDLSDDRIAFEKIESGNLYRSLDSINLYSGKFTHNARFEKPIGTLAEGSLIKVLSPVQNQTRPNNSEKIETFAWVEVDYENCEL